MHCHKIILDRKVCEKVKTDISKALVLEQLGREEPVEICDNAAEDDFKETIRIFLFFDQDPLPMNIEIKPSKLDGAGDGLYATKEFKVNDIICEFKGKLVEEAKAEQMNLAYTQYPNLYGSYMMYFVKNGKRYCVDSTIGFEGSFGRKINHSKSMQNCQPFIGTFNLKNIIYFLATKNIKVGDELYYDYCESDVETLQQNPWLKE